MSYIPLFADPEILEMHVLHAASMPEVYTVYLEDWRITAHFLLNYKYSYETFKSYRRDVERFLLWYWIHHGMSLDHVHVGHVQKYIDFVQSIPREWCMSAHYRRYIDPEQQMPNPQWRPFIHNTTTKNIQLKTLLAILSSYFQYLVDHDRLRKNPIKLLKQKRHLVSHGTTDRVVRKLSTTQWQLVLSLAEAKKDQSWAHCRNWWMLGLFYLLGLRISEVSVTQRHSPMMQDFWRDEHGHWWFKTVGKGNKSREIAVPEALITMLIQVRIFLGLPQYLVVGERTPLLLKTKGQGGLGARHIRSCITACFQEASDHLRCTGQEEDAAHLECATVHWLRHTSISDAVKFRPLEHVRDDAGHSSIMITDIYVDSDRLERHQSAQKKVLTGFKE